LALERIVTTDIHIAVDGEVDGEVAGAMAGAMDGEIISDIITPGALGGELEFKVEDGDLTMAFPLVVAEEEAAAAPAPVDREQLPVLVAPLGDRVEDSRFQTGDISVLNKELFTFAIRIETRVGHVSDIRNKLT